MEDVDEFLSGTRRQFLTTAGTGAAAALAGCSGGDNGGGETSTDATEGSDSAATQEAQDQPTDNSTATQNTSGTEDTTTDGQEYQDPNQRPVEDTVEQRFEKGGAEWIEFEDPQSQVNRPQDVDADFNGSDYEFLNALLFADGISDRSTMFHEDYVQTAYFMVNTGDRITPDQNSEEGDVIVGAVVVAEGEYEEFSQSDDWFPDGFGESDYVQRSTIQRFFEENVADYTEASEDFPEEYLEVMG